MSDEAHLEPRVHTLESEVRALTTSVNTLARSMKEQSDDLYSHINRLATQQSEGNSAILAQQNSNHTALMERQSQLAVESAKVGTLSTGSLVGIFTALLSMAGLVLSIVVVVGGMAIYPMQDADVRLTKNDEKILQIIKDSDTRMLYRTDKAELEGRRQDEQILKTLQHGYEADDKVLNEKLRGQDRILHILSTKALGTGLPLERTAP